LEMFCVRAKVPFLKWVTSESPVTRREANQSRSAVVIHHSGTFGPIPALRYCQHTVNINVDNTNYMGYPSGASRWPTHEANPPNSFVLSVQED
jgi:hypothetical protein